MRIAAVIMLIPFAMFAAQVVVHALRTRGWVSTTASIDSHPDADAQPDAGVLRYCFRDTRGVGYTVPYVGDEAGAGRTIRVRYDPSDPSRHEVPIERAGVVVLFAFTGIVFTGGVLLLTGIVS